MPNRPKHSASWPHAGAKPSIQPLMKPALVRHRLRRLLPVRLAGWVTAIRQVRAAYRLAHGRAPRLFRPRLFSEKIQWRKLFEPDPLFEIFSDKLATRAYVAERAAPELLVPLLWSGDDPDRIPFDRLEAPYVVKSSHASGHVVLVADAAALDAPAIRSQARGWLLHCQATRLVEPGYRRVVPRILVERMLLLSDGTRPLEHRCFVFDGRLRLIQTTLPDANGVMRHGAFHTAQWERLPWLLLSPRHPGPFPRPAMLDRMILLAEQIGAGQAHLRVDCYDLGDSLRVGELTVYSWSGLIPFNPPEADRQLGDLWNLPRPMWRALRLLATRRHGDFG